MEHAQHNRVVNFMVSIADDEPRDGRYGIDKPDIPK
jgi:hypothetical protein